MSVVDPNVLDQVIGTLRGQAEILVIAHGHMAGHPERKRLTWAVRDIRVAVAQLEQFKASCSETSV